ncbi:MAG: tetratricopeptide repeat protein [Mogibacterium sp.]|nr:tetratricopeptide repeat protein [Mogibacterium sp.]
MIDKDNQDNRNNPDNEADTEYIEDRISRYLGVRNHEMIFAELSSDYLNRIGAADILLGVPVPLNAASGEDGLEAEAAAADIGTRDMDMRTILFDMARIVGGDPYFVYTDKYIEFISYAAGEQAEPMLVSEGARAADNGDYEDACMLLRAALRIEPKSRAALYLYGRACKACQELADEDEERAARYKAEAMETFELLTILHPEFAMGYYFLGYEYLNLGLYTKTKLTWQDFLKYSSGTELETSEMDDDMLSGLRDEISARLEELEEPVRIEEGCNRIMTGDYQGGKDILDGFREGRYGDWWPLWYYLGTAEVALGHSEAAEECFKRVLRLYPSNTDAMEELAAIYAIRGDEDSAAKYRNKIRIVREKID